jgi:MFS family permease
MVLQIPFVILASAVFLYFFWKRLREDYPVNSVFSTAFYSLFGLILGYYCSFYLDNGWWFWTMYIGMILGLFVGVIRYKLRILEVYEAVVASSLCIYFLYFLYRALIFREIRFVIAAIVILLLLVFYYFLDNRYRSFTWYKSGKVGFTGLTVSGVFFLIRSAVSIFNIHMISFVGNIEVLISGFLALLYFLGLFVLSRKIS